MIVSPITAEQALITGEFQSREFIKAWEKSFAIDVSAEFEGVGTFYKCVCPSSQYEFFYPFELEGTAELYDKLSTLTWYYTINKWEHKIALEEIRLLPQCQNAVEVGCGSGDFLDLVASEGKAIIGIELNQRAVDQARKKGRNVERLDLSVLEKRTPAFFDAVFSFQVLEHIADPLTFIRSCVNLLSPGGALILTVPDGHGFCGTVPPNRLILDCPPHHMGRWNASAFQYLTKVFPLKLEKIIYEPLAEYHLDWYISEMLSNEQDDNGVVQKIIKRLMTKLLVSYVKAYGIYKRWKGHTLFVKFTKII